MTKTIVNLTLPALIAEIEKVLETYPHNPHQQAFAIPDLRQELIAYVLRRTSSCYVVVDDSNKPSISFNSLPYSEKERLCIQTLIHEGIEQILQKYAQQISHQIPAEVDPSSAPSHWFG